MTSTPSVGFMAARQGQLAQMDVSTRHKGKLDLTGWNEATITDDWVEADEWYAAHFMG